MSNRQRTIPCANKYGYRQSLLHASGGTIENVARSAVLPKVSDSECQRVYAVSSSTRLCAGRRLSNMGICSVSWLEDWFIGNIIPWESDMYLRYTFVIDSKIITNEIGLKCETGDVIAAESSLDQVQVWCYQACNSWLSYSVLTSGASWPQWVNFAMKTFIISETFFQTLHIGNFDTCFVVSYWLLIINLQVLKLAIIMLIWYNV